MTAPTLYIRSLGINNYSMYESYKRPKNPLLDYSVSDDLEFPEPVRLVGSTTNSAGLSRWLSPDYSAIIFLPTRVGAKLGVDQLAK